MRLAWTGGYVSVDMFADNKKISAYSMSVEGNVMKGWIALEPNQKIHLAYNMQSNHSEYKLDMMLDGIIRNTVSHYRNGKKKDRKTEKAIRGKVESASVYVEGKQDQQEMVIDSLNLGIFPISSKIETSCEDQLTVSSIQLAIRYTDGRNYRSSFL